MRIVKPFWRVKYNSYWPKDLTLNRSHKIHAAKWRSFAKSFATGAGRASAILPLVGEGVRTAARIVRRIRNRPGKTDTSGLVPYKTGRRSASDSKMPKRSLPYSRRGAKRRRVYNDPASYRQLSTVVSRKGRRISANKRSRKLWGALQQGIRYRFGWVSDINAASGAGGLLHQPVDAGATSYRVPIVIFPLNNIIEPGSLPPFGGYGLYMTSAGDMFFQAVNGVKADGTTASNQIEQITGDGAVVLGRKALHDWSRIRLCLWGKTKAPSEIKISIVRFPLEQATPEDQMNFTTGVGGSVQQPGKEFWQARVKPLINGPIAEKVRVNNVKAMQVIDSWVVKFNPIDASAETSASDPRGHMKHIDIFRRFNRLINYSKPPPVNDDTYAQLNLPNRTTVPAESYSYHPRWPGARMYLLLESLTPDTVAYNADTATKQATQVTFDWNIQSQYSTIHPYV